MTEPHPRVSFSPQLAVNNVELIETIVAESHNRPTSFNLSTRNLMKIPAEIGLLVRLERLGLNNNRLTSLPTELLNLTALRYLNLKSNSFREFPRVLMQLEALEVLDMSRNNIKRFPIDFGNLIRLRVLSVSNNDIRSLPKYFANMKNLNHFRLDHNPISWPPISVLVCESVDDQSAWLSTLREYIGANEPPYSVSIHTRTSSAATSLSEFASPMSPNDADSSEPKPRIPRGDIPSIRIIEESSRTLISPVLSPSAPTLKSCQELLHLFFISYQPLIDSLIAKYPYLDAYLSVIFGSVALHRAADYMLQVVTKLSEQVEVLDISSLERQLGSVNFQSLVIIRSLKGFLSNKTITSEQSSSFKVDIAALARDTKALAAACKSSLLTSLLNADRPFDTRILNGLLLDWRSVNSSFQEALTLFSGGKTKLSLLALTESHSSASALPTSSLNDIFTNIHSLLDSMEKNEAGHFPVSVKKLVLKSLQLCDTRDLFPFLDALGELLAECKRIDKKSILESCSSISTQAQLLVKGAESIVL